MKKIRIFLVNLAKKNKTLRIFFRNILNLKNKLKYSYYKTKYKMDDKTILFEAFGGRNYTCSPKAIYEKMLTMKEFKDYTFVWSFIDPSKHEVKKDKRLKIIKSKSKEYYKYISISKYWIVNSIIEEGITKKKDQVYVQCWHGTPLKRLRYDIVVNGASLNSVEEIRKRNDIDAKKFDYFISPSKYCTEKFTSAFNLKALGKENIIIEEGYPRNDFLFNKTKKDIDAIKKKLGLPLDKKVIFYLPTFRDNQHTSGVGYTYKTEVDFEKLQKELGQDYIILFRAHYLVANEFNFEKYKGFIYDVSKFDDINELYIVSDMLITDYSSVFFDYANLKRPIIFYMYDFEQYKDSIRGFYIDLKKLPGSITKTEDELIKEIKKMNNSFKYNKIYEEFNKKYNYLDDGKATERTVVNVIDKEEKK